MNELRDTCDLGGFIFPGSIPPPSAEVVCPTPDTCPDIAYLPMPNVFRNVNTIPGLRLEAVETDKDYQLRVIDFELGVDASLGARVVTAPLALGSGQFYHIRKIDDSGNTVTILPQTGDLINGQSFIVLGSQYDDALIQDAALGTWDRWGLGGAGFGVDLSDFARLSLENTFLQVNNFTGVRLSTKTVGEDYKMTADDFMVRVDASAGPVTITAMSSLDAIIGERGQLQWIRKIDDSDEIVTVRREPSTDDLIDGAISVDLIDQYAAVQLFAGAPGVWDDLQSEGEGGITPVDTRPTTANEIVAAGVTLGLWP